MIVIVKIIIIATTVFHQNWSANIYYYHIVIHWNSILVIS